MCLSTNLPAIGAAIVARALSLPTRRFYPGSAAIIGAVSMRELYVEFDTAAGVINMSYTHCTADGPQPRNGPVRRCCLC